MNYLKKPSLPKRSTLSKKGDNGRVLVIGGSPEYVGAVALAAHAALRSGADWVSILTPQKVGWAINTLSADVVVKKVNTTQFSSAHVSVALKEEKGYDAVLIGNGISLKSLAFCRSFMGKSTKPLIIDADALKAVAIQDVDHAILTPHKKEFEILLKNSAIKGIKELQKQLKNNVVVLKGPVDQIITKKNIYYNKTGNAGMSKAGTGDVLAGLCAGFYVQTKDPLKAAKLAAYYCGLCGDILLKKKKGFSYLASDLADEIKCFLR